MQRTAFSLFWVKQKVSKGRPSSIGWSTNPYVIETPWCLYTYSGNKKSLLLFSINTTICKRYFVLFLISHRLKNSHYCFYVCRENECLKKPTTLYKQYYSYSEICAILNNIFKSPAINVLSLMQNVALQYAYNVDKNAIKYYKSKFKKDEISN